MYRRGRSPDGRTLSTDITCGDGNVCEENRHAKRPIQGICEPQGRRKYGRGIQSSLAPYSSSNVRPWEVEMKLGDFEPSLSANDLLGHNYSDWTDSGVQSECCHSICGVHPEISISMRPGRGGGPSPLAFDGKRDDIGTPLARSGPHHHNHWPLSSQPLALIITTTGPHHHNHWPSSSQPLALIITTTGPHHHNHWPSSSQPLALIITTTGPHHHNHWP
ncbi:unnamed protein product [Boreogadus saida]